MTDLYDRLVNNNSKNYYNVTNDPVEQNVGNASNPLDNPEDIGALREYYYKARGKVFKDDKELINHFYQDFRTADVSLIKAGIDAGRAFGVVDPAHKDLYARVVDIWERAPAWGDDPRVSGWTALKDYTVDSLPYLIPEAAIGAGSAAVQVFKAGGKLTAAQAMKEAGKDATKAAIADARRKAVAKVAGTEAAIGAGFAGAGDAAIQARNIGAEVQDEYDLGRTALATGIGAAAGGALGFAAGSLGGRAAERAFTKEGGIVDRAYAPIEAAQAREVADAERLAAEEAARSAREAEAAEVDRVSKLPVPVGDARTTADYVYNGSNTADALLRNYIADSKDESFTRHATRVLADLETSRANSGVAVRQAEKNLADFEARLAKGTEAVNADEYAAAINAVRQAKQDAAKWDDPDFAMKWMEERLSAFDAFREDMVRAEADFRTRSAANTSGSGETIRMGNEANKAVVPTGGPAADAGAAAGRTAAGGGLSSAADTQRLLPPPDGRVAGDGFVMGADVGDAAAARAAAERVAPTLEYRPVAQLEAPEGRPLLTSERTYGDGFTMGNVGDAEAMQRIVAEQQAAGLDNGSNALPAPEQRLAIGYDNTAPNGGVRGDGFTMRPNVDGEITVPRIGQEQRLAIGFDPKDEAGRIKGDGFTMRDATPEEEIEAGRIASGPDASKRQLRAEEERELTEFLKVRPIARRELMRGDVSVLRDQAISLGINPIDETGKMLPRNKLVPMVLDRQAELAAIREQRATKAIQRGKADTTVAEQTPTEAAKVASKSAEAPKETPATEKAGEVLTEASDEAIALDPKTIEEQLPAVASRMLDWDESEVEDLLTELVESGHAKLAEKLAVQLDTFHQAKAELDELLAAGMSAEEIAAFMRGISGEEAQLAAGKSPHYYLYNRVPKLEGFSRIEVKRVEAVARKVVKQFDQGQNSMTDAMKERLFDYAINSELRSIRSERNNPDYGVAIRRSREIHNEIAAQKVAAKEVDAVRPSKGASTEAVGAGRVVEINTDPVTGETTQSFGRFQSMLKGVKKRVNPDGTETAVKDFFGNVRSRYSQVEQQINAIHIQFFGRKATEAEAAKGVVSGVKAGARDNKRLSGFFETTATSNMKLSDGGIARKGDTIYVDLASTATEAGETLGKGSWRVYGNLPDEGALINESALLTKEELDKARKDGVLDKLAAVAQGKPLVALPKSNPMASNIHHSVSSLNLPAGRVPAIRHRDKGVVYYLTREEVNAGKGMSDLLAKSADGENPANFVTGSVPDTTKSLAGALRYYKPTAEEKFTVKEYVMNYYAHGKSMEELDAISIDPSVLPPSIRSDVRTAADIHRVIDMIENDNIPVGIEDWRLAVRDLQTLYQLQEQYPVKRSVTSRTEAIQQVNDLFARYSAEEQTFARSLVRRIGGDGRIGPEIGAANLGQALGKLDDNRIVLNTHREFSEATPMRGRAGALVHEVHHWAWKNILDPKDKAVFLEWMEARYFEMKDGKVRLSEEALKKDLPNYNFNPKAHVSIAEVFAELGERHTLTGKIYTEDGPVDVVPRASAANQMAIARVADKIKALMQKAGKIVKQVFDGFTKGQWRLDPQADKDVLKLFEKVLPYNPHRMKLYDTPNFKGIFNNSTEAHPNAFLEKLKGKSPGVYRKINGLKQNFDDLEKARVRLESALNTGDMRSIYNALTQASRSFRGRIGSDTSREFIRSLTDDNTIGILVNTHHYIDMLLGNLFDPQVHGKNLYRVDFEWVKSLPRENRNKGVDNAEAYFARLTKQLASEHGNGRYNPVTGDGLTGVRVVDMNVIESDRTIRNALEQIASRTVENLRMVQVEFNKALNREIGQDFVQSFAIDLVNKNEVTPEILADAGIRVRAIEKEIRKKALDKVASTQTREAKKVKVRPTTDQAVGDLTKLSDAELEAAVAGAPDTAVRQYANEILRRERTKPIDAAETVRPELVLKTAAELEAAYVVAARAGKWAEADQIAAAFRLRDGLDKLGIAKPKTKVVKESLYAERAAYDGVEVDDGVPLNATESIRATIRAATHREPAAEYAQRKLLFRLINLLNHNLRREAGDAMIVTFDDIHRLVGSRYEGDGSAVFVDLQDEGYKLLRDKLRRNVSALIGVSDRATDMDVMHEIGHMVFKTMNDEDRAFVHSAFASADDAIKREVKSRYTGRSDEELAEEWYVESFNQYAAGRVLRGDMFAMRTGGADVRYRSKLDLLADRLYESVAYVVNGLLGRKTLRQTFRHFLNYGDMLADRLLSSPLPAVKAKVGALHPSLVPDYAKATGAADGKARQAAKRAFVKGGIGADRDGNPVVFYRGGASLAPSDGKFGPGIYATTDHALAESYAGMPSREAVARAIAEADIPAQQRAYLDDVAADLSDRLLPTYQASRSAYADLVQQIEEARRLGDDALADSLVEEAAYHRSLVEDYAGRMSVLHSELEKAGVVNATTTPSHINLQNPFDFRSDTFYVWGENRIMTVLDRAAAMGFIEPDAIARIGKALTDLQVDNDGMFSGAQLYNVLVNQLAGELGADVPAARGLLTDVLRDLGHDGLRVTEMRTLNSGAERGTEAVVLFGQAGGSFGEHQIAAVDDEVFSFIEPRFGENKLGDDPLIGTALLESIVNGKTVDPAKMNMAGMRNYMDQVGYPKEAIEFFESLWKGKEPTEQQQNIIERMFNPINRNSSVLREKYGMHYVADRIRKNEGVAHYEERDQMFGTFAEPIFTALKKLDNRTFAEVVRDDFSNAWRPKTPAEHEAVYDALQFGVDSDAFRKMNDTQKGVAKTMIEQFRRAKMYLESIGVDFGTIENYIPQVWDVRAIEENLDSFVRSLAEHFVKADAIEGRGNLRIEDAMDEASALANHIIDNNGVYLPESKFIRQSAVKHGFERTRIINLNTKINGQFVYGDDYQKLRGFMNRDLQSLSAQYFDKVASKATATKSFGLDGHGFYDYMTVTRNGLVGVKQVLTGGKIARSAEQTTARASTGEVVESSIAEQHIHRLEDQEAHAIMRAIGDIVKKHGDNRQAAANEVDDLLSAVQARHTTKEQPEGLGAGWDKRQEAIVAAIRDHGLDNKRVNNDGQALGEYMLNVAFGRPNFSSIPGSEAVAGAVGWLSFVNNIRLLGTTIVASLPDRVLPLIRSGNFGAWVKGFKNSTFSRDPEVMAAMRNIGVNAESMIYERFANNFDSTSNYKMGRAKRFSNLFFKYTGLTPWTDHSRQMSGIVAWESFKAEQKIAQRLASDPTGRKRRQRAINYLKQFGLESYADPSAPSLENVKALRENNDLRKAIIKFSNESTFIPNMDDVPAWAQSPWLSLAWSLKSYGAQMGRLARHVTWEEAVKNKNIRPLAYMMTVGVAGGAGTLAALDVVRMRGGEENREAGIREDRGIMKSPFARVAEMFGVEEGDDADKFFGWYLEGLMQLGGFGLAADILYRSAENVDNGAYGTNMIMSTILGPTYGLTKGMIENIAGVIDDKESNAKERQAVRNLASYVPVLGTMRGFREGVTDSIAGEASSGDGGGGGKNRGFNTTGFSTSGFKTSGF